jgi:hypothetical protein
MKDYEEYTKEMEKYLVNYIPPKKDWTPVDDAIFKPKDLFRIPLKKANKLQFNALKYAFSRHYKLNPSYKKFSKDKDVSPTDIKKYDDLHKIPLLSGDFFKGYPVGRDFARWLSSICTGEVPKIGLKNQYPSYDEVIDAFYKAGILVAFSSGTSGRHTFIPRDIRTFNANQYSLAKTVASMAYPRWQYDSFAYTLMPSPFKTYLWGARNLEVYTKVVKNMEYVINRPITTETLRIMMSQNVSGLKNKIIKKISASSSKKTVDKIIKWLENHKNCENLSLIGAPFILHFLCQKLKQTNKTFDFSGRGFVATGGGWKIHQDKKLTHPEFRKEIKEYLGVEERFCLDTYGMVETNGWNIHCPEGHYFHTSHSFLKPMVLDEEYNPIEEYGKWGRYAFLDASAFSYPGFIATGDKVRILEHCPVCDRPGPVIESDIRRASGTEMRGCAEEMRRMMSIDIGEK